MKGWRTLAVALSILANVVLLTGVLYLKVPAVHSAFLPAWRFVRTGRWTAPPPPVSRILPRITPTNAPGEGEVSLHFTAQKDAVAITLHAKPGSEVNYVVQLDDGTELLVPAAEPRFTWPLQASEKLNRVVVFEAATPEAISFVGEIEVLRTPGDQVAGGDGTTSSDGSVVVYRCTFAIHTESPFPILQEESVYLSDLPESERIAIRALLPELAREQVPDYRTSDELVAEMGRLLDVLCAKGLLYVSASGNDRFYELPRSEALVELSTKHLGNLCKGLRSVFVSVALACHWLSPDQIREVDAFRFGPIPHLTDNSHALLDVRIPGGRWLLLDPTKHTVTMSQDGLYLSSEDVQRAGRDGTLDRIVVKRVASPCGETYDLGGFDTADQDPANYNYWSHFAHLTLRELSLPAEDEGTD